jgi:photosystem II stability/assembly factor-like uncharacterized protein
MLVFRFATTRGIVTVREKNGARAIEDHFLSSEDIQVLARQPDLPAIIYAGTYGNGLFRTENAGRDWRKLIFPEAFIRSLAFAADPSGEVYAGTEPANLRVSSDGGHSWRDLNIRSLPESREWSLPYSPRGGALRTLAIHPSEPDAILGGVEQGGVIRSTNRGRDWTITHSELPKDVHLLSVDQQNHQRVFAATGDGLSLSLDGGRTWEAIWDSYTRAVLVHPTSPNIVFGGPAEEVGERGSIRMSQDGGVTWADAHGGRSFPLPDMVEFFVIPPNQPESVFAVLSEGGVIQSEIDKISWRDFEPRIEEAQFLEICES